MAKTEQPRAGVLIPAAGQGRRLGGEPKQYRFLGGLSVLERTLEVFQKCDDVSHIVVASRPSDCDDLAARFQQCGFDRVVAVIPGGATRQDSVRNALRALPLDANPVLVHDAVRPFVTSAVIRAVVRAALKYGSAAPAIAVTDTLRERRAAVFGATVPRDGLVRMQTPQAFRREVIEEAFARSGDAVATDDVELVQRAGFEVRIVDGNAANIKITTPDDWRLARVLWGSGWEDRES